jgi:hypothetical protein
LTVPDPAREQPSLSGGSGRPPDALDQCVVRRRLKKKARREAGLSSEVFKKAQAASFRST